MALEGRDSCCCCRGAARDEGTVEDRDEWREDGVEMSRDDAEDDNGSKF